MQENIVAWAFYNKDGSLRFIIEDKQRMELWKKAHDGKIIPLVALDNDKKQE